MILKRVYMVWMDSLAGRRKPGLVPTRLLHAQAFSPFGQFLSEEAVAKAWETLAGSRPVAPWMLLGQSDTPSGTRWRLAFVPSLEAPSRLQARDGELLLPEALPVHRAMAALPQAGWSRRQLRWQGSLWIGLWLQECCERLVKLPHGQALAEELAWQESRWPESQGAPVVEIPPPEPTAALCEELAQASPEASLLPPELELAGSDRALRRRTVAILGTAAAALAVVTGLLAVAGLAVQLQLERMQTRTARIRPTLERIERLELQRNASLTSLSANPQLLQANPDVSRWLRQLARSLEGGVRAQALTLQARAPKGYQASVELSVADWGDLEPLQLRLRGMPGVTRASLDQQTRKEGRVHCVAKLEGTWP